MGNIYFADKLEAVNHFSNDGVYSSQWVSVALDDSCYIMPSESFVYGCVIGKKVDYWEFRVMDYINYNLLYDRNIIFLGDERDYRLAKEKYSGHSINDTFLRAYEDDIIIHSTTSEGYKNILNDNMLKSWNVLKKERLEYEDEPIGAMLGDPEDFRDYIMFGSGIQCEIVVLSKQRRMLCRDENEEYIPGARFYFDATQLANDGLLVRDGLHYKVKDILLLNYAVFIATMDNVVIEGKITPKTFSQRADTMFNSQFRDR